MKTDIIKHKDAEFDIQQASIMTKLAAMVVPWGIPITVLPAVTPFQTAWATSWNIAKNKGTRTPANVKAKDLARFNYEKGLRPVLQQYVQKNKVVTNEDRIAMGIPPLDTTRSRSTVPTTVPQVEVKAGNGNNVKVFMKQGVDEEGVSRRGKPEGVGSMEVAIKVGDPVPESAEDCLTRFTTGRSPLLLHMLPADAGKRIYVFARWINTRHEQGPWTSDGISMIVPG